MSVLYSFIIPVYNRPVEVYQLLESLSRVTGTVPFEVVIIEDGSLKRCDLVCERFRESLTINYHFKQNTGPGDSRNYGMRVATGNYFIILDSDCIVPPAYLELVDAALKIDFVHCYGGPDAALERFSNLQKAINYTMTSFWTTGGLRGSSEQLDKFQPRSFNMGLSKEAYSKTGGFGRIHPGEDPDLVLRLWNLGYRTKLISEAFVYHERRLSWRLFYKQVRKFGMVRVILNKWHAASSRAAYMFPSVFIAGLLASLPLVLLGFYLPIWCYGMYFLVIAADATLKNNITVGVYSVFATLVQFTGYGLGFAVSFYQITIRNKQEQEVFPELFFKVK